jgi:hypothetical protein
MLGTQVPQEAKTVKWADGHITVLPTLIRDGRNILVDDEKLVKKKWLHFLLLNLVLPW